jgi:hypothetical protein
VATPDNRASRKLGTTLLKVRFSVSIRPYVYYAVFHPRESISAVTKRSVPN